MLRAHEVHGTEDNSGREAAIGAPLERFVVIEWAQSVELEHP